MLSGTSTASKRAQSATNLPSRRAGIPACRAPDRGAPEHRRRGRRSPLRRRPPSRRAGPRRSARRAPPNAPPRSSVSPGTVASSASVLRSCTASGTTAQRQQSAGCAVVAAIVGRIGRGRWIRRRTRSRCRVAAVRRAGCSARGGRPRGRPARVRTRSSLVEAGAELVEQWSGELTADRPLVVGLGEQVRRPQQRESPPAPWPPPSPARRRRSVVAGGPGAERSGTGRAGRCRRAPC